METTGSKIRSLLLSGHSNREIRKLVGAAGATVSYHARALGLEKGNRPKYDWLAIQCYIDYGHTLAEVKDTFGMSGATLTNARKTGKIKYIQKYQMSANELINSIKGKISHNDRRLLRKKLVAEGMEYKCLGCGISNWNEAPISLELDHMDGDARNNQIANLRLLCPNCHSQTPTWRGRNAIRY